MKRLGLSCFYWALLFVTICGGIGQASTVEQSKLIDITNQARAAYDARQFETAELKYAEAVKLAAASAPAKARIALLSNLGAAYREDRKYAESEEAFKTALAVSDAAHLNYDAATKLAMQQYALLLRKLKRIAEADAMEIRAAAGILPQRISAVGTEANPKQPQQGQDPRALYAVEASPKGKESKLVTLSIDVEADFQKTSLDELKNRLSRDPQNWRLIGQVGAKYLEENRYAEAAEEFKQALQSASSATNEQKTQLRFFMAQAYMRADHPEEALDAFRKLCADNPDDPRFLRGVAACYDAVGDMSSELAAWEVYLQRWPSDENVAAISQNVERLRRDVATSAQLDKLVDNKPTDAELRKSFFRSAMPLKVFVNEKDDDRITFSDSRDAQVTENTPGSIIQRSMDLWTRASDGRVTFALTNSAGDADIICNFTDEPDGLETESALGITSYRAGSGGRHIADIQLLTVLPKTTQTMPRAEFAAAALHEFGHALGLDHSNRVSDVMYRAVHAKPLVNLSDNDRDRVCKLYTYKP